MKKIIVFIFLFPLAVSAQKNYGSLMDKYMQAQVTVNDFSGAVLVAQKGKIIYEKAFGMANREWNIPNTVQTKFRIGSLTKQFTAAAILQLAEQGKLSLDDKLSKYLPDFPKGDSVTIHMLLNHTSGIRSFTDIPTVSTVGALAYAKDSIVSFFKNQPYDFSPGSQYHYNNSGYFLLGCIIEKVSGQTYSNYINQNLVAKAGLQNTSVNQLDSILANRAAGYTRTASGWKNAAFISMEFPFSAGAIISTVEDLYKWQKALFDGKIVSPASFTKMTTPHLHNYGYGLWIDSFQHHRRIQHDGSIPGFHSYLVRYPEDEISIAFISNNEIIGGIPDALAAIAFGLPVTPPYKHLKVTVSSKALERYRGSKYKDSHSEIDSFIVKEGKLYVCNTENNKTEVLELAPESETKFYVEDSPYIQIEFQVTNAGKVTRAFRIDNGIKSEMKKL